MPISGRPFLDLVIEKYVSTGLITRLILATGYASETIKLADLTSSGNIPILVTHEALPLGTGGAIKNVFNTFSPSELVLIVNGDSLAGINSSNIFQQIPDQSLWDFLIGTVEVENASRYGRVIADDRGVICGFHEKTAYPFKGLINCGLYIAKSKLLMEQLNETSKVNISLENDVFNQLLSKYTLRTLHIDGNFIDIGIPEDYSKALAMLGEG
jgi:NDP-sugar pyrophosphorylase family protein